MTENHSTGEKTSRITCAVHSSLRRLMTESLSSLRLNNVLMENGKSIRQYARTRMRGLPGRKLKLNTSPVDLYRFTVTGGNNRELLKKLIAAVDLSRSGRGMIFSQSVLEYGRSPVSPAQKMPEADLNSAHKAKTGGEGEGILLPDLSLISCILSAGERTEQIARIALDLGTCVPVVSQGIGSGMRDYLGLLRVTIPPEKDVLQLMVPEYDTESIITFLIEEGRLNLPGSGFLYSTPVDVALPDRMLRIGQQHQTASMEQIITAIDELKAGTHWRKRFVAMEEQLTGKTPSLRHDNREIVFVCKEGRSDKLMDAAIKAGAGGGTISRARRLKTEKVEDDGGETAACERGMICSPAETAETILEALSEVADKEKITLESLQLLAAPTVYSHE